MRTKQTMRNKPGNAGTNKKVQELIKKVEIINNEIKEIKLNSESENNKIVQNLTKQGCRN
ncbi:hypothetical protein HYD54_03925 [Mycoplasmopsis bovis]|nr:hypothetical protein [Mycoplasmopsis bovis]QQH71939.1 hypothetical protein HYD54_03925 [Mycoplasmopsis bovis]